MKEYLVIYDVRGIQKYIFRTNKIKEITGASVIVRNLLHESIMSYFKDKSKVITDWEKAESFGFFNNKERIIEFIYEGGGNLLIAFRENIDGELEKFNKYLQVQFLKNSYSLSLSYAAVEINENSDYLKKREEVKRKLKDIKTKMPDVVTCKSLPITEADSITGLPISNVEEYIKVNLPEMAYKFDEFIWDKEEKGKKRKLSIESALKLIRSVDIGQTQFDDYFKEQDNVSKNNDKTMLAIVHIDGNDMAAMINNYVNVLKQKKINGKSFEEDVRNSRQISATINEVFNQKVNEIFNYDKYKNNTRLIINSGDDITYMCLAKDAINITKEIMEMIESNYLAPYYSNGTIMDESMKTNNFSSCAGICFVHSHFPFIKAYEIAEEVCSLAKSVAKKDRITTKIMINNTKYDRPSSYLDFEIIEAGVIRPISETRKTNDNLYLRPYRVTNEESDIISKNHINSLINNLKLFKESRHRSIVKQIRNVYEEPMIFSNILFEKIASRAPFGRDFIYNAFDDNDEKALYYDATSLIDLFSED